jgi:hypothetical protein
MTILLQLNVSASAYYLGSNTGSEDGRVCHVEGSTVSLKDVLESIQWSMGDAVSFIPFFVCFSAHAVSLMPLFMCLSVDSVLLAPLGADYQIIGAGPNFSTDFGTSVTTGKSLNTVEKVSFTCSLQDG